MHVRRVLLALLVILPVCLAEADTVSWKKLAGYVEKITKKEKKCLLVMLHNGVNQDAKTFLMKKDWLQLVDHANESPYMEIVEVVAEDPTGDISDFWKLLKPFDSNY
eukprot:Sspe_Gene.59867::Locus_32926_Transcript_1_1_Confidence_1.000_Length_1162::g.59867::m.59867